MVDNQHMNFDEFLNDIEVLVIMVGHDYIKEHMELIKDKMILDTKNICTFEEAYKL